MRSFKVCECGKICKKNNGEFLISGHFTGDVMNCTGYTGIYTYLHDKCVCVCLKPDNLTPIYGCFLSWRKWFGGTVCSNPNTFGVRLVQNFNHASPLAAQNLATLPFDGFSHNLPQWFSGQLMVYPIFRQGHKKWSTIGKAEPLWHLGGPELSAGTARQPAVLRQIERFKQGLEIVNYLENHEYVYICI